MSQIDGFQKVLRTLEQQTAMRGQSTSTLNNYVRRIAAISLKFNRLPEHISDDELNEYLTGLALSAKSPSRSNFKHAVYGLRYYFRHIGQGKRAINLPPIKKDDKLPTILNQSELKELFATPKLLKHRIILSLIYSAGLRSQEVIRLKIADIDFERKTIHIRRSKYNKDRIVPLSDLIAKGIRKYLAAERPHDWLFNGKEADGRYSSKGLSWIMRETLKKSSIKKKVNLHSLRHSYATHLLEQGASIVTVKELLGHADIATTMVYLHVAQCEKVKAHSPFDRLYSTPKCSDRHSN
ncbi:MAG: tyrosine-type recombinase/integrase [Bacilli bacterium]|jgi:site-specific recombinase XerD|nr:tyrosine-type recombinase/integrase [Candidatus Cloacimonadota bacterium]